MKGDKTVAVIGGGAGGCGSSLALAERGWKVHLFEKNTIFSGTSGITCGRLGLGFHYIDLETSLKLMRATIRLVKTFPGHCVGEDFPSSHPIRRGRYFITNDSLASPHDILEVMMLQFAKQGQGRPKLKKISYVGKYFAITFRTFFTLHAIGVTCHCFIKISNILLRHTHTQNG